MLLSRFWYVVMAVALGAVLFVLFLSTSMYDRASVRAMGEALAGDSRDNGTRAVAATDPRNVRLDCIVAAPTDAAVYGPRTASGRVCDPALHRLSER